MTTTRDVGRQFVAGTASGVCLVVVGFPWDTLKVKMQAGTAAATRPSSLYSTIQTTIRENGVRGLYFGVSAPLVFTGVINTVLWGFQFNLVKLLSPSPAATTTTTATPPPPTSIVMRAAVLSGVLITSIVTPMEVVKSRLQVGDGTLGPVGMARQIIREQQGSARGLYRGALAVALVRSSNWSYFGAYSAIQARLEETTALPREVRALVAGGTAGMCFWLVALPFDTVKARMMIDWRGENGGLWQTCRTMLGEPSGWRGFYRGLSPCLIRAFPANAAAFFGFETTMRLLS